MTDQPSKTPQELGDEFHMMVGYCIAEWARVEDKLFQICQRCLGCSPQRAAIVYFRTPTIRSRLELTDELIRTVLPNLKKKAGDQDHPDLKLWTKLLKDFKEPLEIRNRMAHHPVWFHLVSGSDPANLSMPEWYFFIHISNQERQRGRPKELSPSDPLIIADLKSHLNAVGKLKDRLHNFLYNMLEKHASASPSQDAPETNPSARPRRQHQSFPE